MITRTKPKFVPGPLVGRSAFRGVINPLILAGGRTGQSPDIWAAEYANADPNPVAVQEQRISIVRPPAEVCPTSRLLNEWCDQMPDTEFCKKRNSAATSKECKSIEDPKCPMTPALKKHCSDPFNKINSIFCRGMTRPNGDCFEKAMKADEDEERARKEARDKKAADDAAAKAKADAEAEQAKINNWKVTRGCRFQKADLTQAQMDAMRAKGINPVTTKTPCTYSQFTDSNIGKTVSIYGQQWNFLGWTPERP